MCQNYTCVEDTDNKKNPDTYILNTHYTHYII